MKSKTDESVDGRSLLVLDQVELLLLRLLLLKTLVGRKNEVRDLDLVLVLDLDVDLEVVGGAERALALVKKKKQLKFKNRQMKNKTR